MTTITSSTTGLPTVTQQVTPSTTTQGSGNGNDPPQQPASTADTVTLSPEALALLETEQAVAPRSSGSGNDYPVKN